MQICGIPLSSDALGQYLSAVARPCMLSGFIYRWSLRTPTQIAL